MGVVEFGVTVIVALVIFGSLFGHWGPVAVLVTLIALVILFEVGKEVIDDDTRD